MFGEQVHLITGVTRSVKGRGSKAGNLMYRDMMDEEGRVIGVRIDSNDDSGFWLEVLFPKTSQPKETVVKKDDGDEDDDDDAFRQGLMAYFTATVENKQAAAIHGGRGEK